MSLVSVGYQHARMMSSCSELISFEQGIGFINQYGSYNACFREKQVDMFVIDYYKNRIAEMCEANEEGSIEFKATVAKLKESSKQAISHHGSSAHKATNYTGGSCRIHCGHGKPRSATTSQQPAPAVE